MRINEQVLKEDHQFLEIAEVDFYELLNKNGVESGQNSPKEK